MDVATLGLKAESSSVDKASTSLDKLSSTAKRTQLAADKLASSNTKLSTTNSAVAGTTNQVTQAENKLTAAHTRNTAAVKKYSTAVQGGGMHTANLGAQFNDIGVMLASGQSPLMLALQQGTQVNQVLDQMGSGGVSRLAALRSAFLSVVSPANLLTIGVIAGGVALAQWAISAVSAGEDADKFKKQLDEARDSLKGLNAELRGLRLGVDSTELTFLDAINAQRIKLAEAQERLNAASGHSIRGAKNRLQTERENLIALEEQLNSYRQGNIEKNTLKNITRETADAERLLGEQLSQTAVQLAESNRIAELLRAGVSAVTIEGLQLAGIDLSKPIVDAEAASVLLASGLSDSQIEALELAGVNISDPITKAADEAARLANELFKASRVGLRQTLSDEDALFSQPLTAAPTTRARENFNRITTRANRPTRARKPQLTEQQRKDQQIFNENQREAQRYITQTRTALESYNLELADLAELNQLGFFKDSPEAYSRAVKSVTEEFRNAQFEPLIQGIESISDSIGNAIANGEDLGDVFKNTLKQMSANIISSGINDSLKQMLIPSGGGSNNAISSFVGSLFGGFRAAGGPVSAGKSYVVGENGPEMFSPQRSGTIIPNHAMGSVGGSTQQIVDSRTYNIDARGAEVGVEQKIKEALQSYDKGQARQTAIEATRKAFKAGGPALA